MAIIFPFEPNWSERVSVDREYKTEIITSRDLTEQRKALRQEPRRRFEFTVQGTSRRADDAWQFFERRAQEAFVMPDFTRVARTSATAAKNSNVLTIPGASELPWLKVGSKVMVGSPFRRELPVMDYASAAVSDDWKYKLEPSGSTEDYSAAAYDDSAWDVAPGGFGESFGETPAEGTYIAGGADDQAIWIRFTLPLGAAGEGFLLTLWHDDGPELWVDGVAVDLPTQVLNEGDYFRSRVYVPATNAPQVVAYKVTDTVPYGNDSYIYAGVEWESTSPEAEIVEVVEINGDDVTISNVTSDRPAGTLVRPPVYGRLDQSISGNFATVNAGDWSITFIEDPNEDYREAYVSAPDSEFFDGREVFMRKPNWLERAQPGITGYLETLDMGRGVMSHRNGQTFNHRLWSATYRNMSSTAAEALIQFAHRNRGRRGEFWMPTWRQDLKPIGIFEKDSKLVTVEGQVERFRENPSRRIMIAHNADEIEFHEVESVAADGDNTVLQLRDALARTLVGLDGEQVIFEDQFTLVADTNAGTVGNGIAFDGLHVGGRVVAELVGSEAWSAWVAQPGWVANFHIVWDNGDVTFHDLAPGGSAISPWPSTWPTKAEAVAQARPIQFTARHPSGTIVLDYGHTISDNAGEITVDLTGYNADSVDRVSFMPLYRMATDSLSLQFNTSRSSDAKINMQQLNEDPNYDGHYEITTQEIANGTNAPQIDITGYTLISTADTIGKVVLKWERYATRTSSGLDASASLSIRVRCRSAAGSNLVDTTITGSGYGLITLDGSVEVPKDTVSIWLNYTSIPVVSGDTTFGVATVKTFELRGRP